MEPIKALKTGAIVSFVLALVLLLFGGLYAVDKVPPLPERVTANGETLFTVEDIEAGKHVYQRYGLMDHGAIWGHGSLRGMDFSAATLHMMGEAMRDYYASPDNPADDSYEQLTIEKQGGIDAKVKREIHENRYDDGSKTLRLTRAEAYALERIKGYWEKVFSEGEKDYGFLPGTVKKDKELDDIGEFFFWTAWAAGTDRPGMDYTYTNNWPPDESVGNTASSEAMLWSVVSILALLLLLGFIIYIVHRYQYFYGEEKGVDAAKRILEMPLTESQRATAKYFLVAGLLFVVQILNGGLLAHYTVHPGTFYINFIAEFIPYSWAKSWHLQLAIFWIAISWIGTAILIAPLIAGKEPPGQKHLVNILFVATFIVVVGSLTGQVLSIKGLLGDWWFWLGHQGWEYLELGRIWQILLFGGLVFWLVIVYRPLGALIRGKESGDEHQRALVAFYVLSAIAVVAFFGFGLFYGKGTHLTIADYWRWMVVHIWVETIFEFFGVAVIALFLVSLGLVTAKSALRIAYFTAILVFMAGILGTAHHYYWFGGPSIWLAIGGVFSSLEPIPLILLVVRAWMEYGSIKKAGGDFPYKWPLYFLTASSFWNFLGAGVFGFLINLPIVNYYEHATYLTANHGHTALFGVYGMLAISLILFSWRSLVKNENWNDKILKVSFWGLNGGLFLMFLTSLLPVGLIQLWESYDKGFWYARSAEFFNQPAITWIGTWRIVPDTIIIVVGALPLLWFLVSTYIKLRPCGEKQQCDWEPKE